MPRKDTYHDDVRVALEKDGWTITDDPMRIRWEGSIYYPDLGAERFIAAEKNSEKIAIEIKTFGGDDFNSEFYSALGQYDTYTIAFSDIEPDRKVILAVSDDIFKSYFERKSVQKIIELKKISIVIYNVKNQEIEKWIK